MNIKPIKTETDYNAALQAVDTLMDAKIDTPEGGSLDVLVTLMATSLSRDKINLVPRNYHLKYRF